MKKFFVVRVYSDFTLGGSMFASDNVDDAKKFAELMARNYGDCNYTVVQVEK